MSLWHELNTPTQVVILTTATALVLAGGYFGYQALQPDLKEPAAIVEPVAAVEEPVAAPTPKPPAAPELPKIDTWRVSQDGEAVVAGLAVPGAKVDILIDGNPVAGGVADAKGEFAILFTLPANAAPSLMWLTMTAPDEATLVSEERIALGPIKGPEPVATEPVASEPVATEAAEAETVTAEPEPAPEEEAPVALLLNDEGAVVLQGNDPDPVVAANVTIETIAYTPEGEVQVGGRGEAGAPLRLYLDNTEAGMIDVPESGTWLITLADAEPGIYTLRVDELDKDGKVTSRFETPFKRESRAALAALTEKLAETTVAPETAPTPPSAATLVPDPEPVTPVTEVAVAAEPEAAPEVAPEPEPEATAAEPEPTAVVAAEPEPAPEPQAVAAAEPEPATPVVEPESTVAATEAAPEVVEPEPTVEVAAVVSTPEPAPEPQPTAAAAITVTVQPGFTLWGIAEDNYGDGVLYVQLFKANKDQIKDPDLIYPGQVFAVPEEANP